MKPRVLFRVACGPGRGFGHIVRAARLGNALDARVWISVLGGPLPGLSRRRVRVVHGGPSLVDALGPDLVVLDTPVASDAARWLGAARRRGVPVASVHDAGIAPVASDLAIDGSLAARRPIAGARRTLLGPRFMIVDPAIARTRRVRCRERVVIALGGGPRVGLARSIATALRAACPAVQVQIAAGFAASSDRTAAGVELLGPRRSLAPTLARADVAVVAGGVTLYEAAALGVPVVAVPVVAGQRAAVAAFERAGAAIAASPRSPRGIARAAAALLGDPSTAERLGRSGRRLVDGRGAERVASALMRLAGSGRV
ncbi:MAG TPA: glycosyltransferase [Vicinamibacterales bacterium]